MCCCFICCLTERPLQRNTRRPDLKMNNQETSLNMTMEEMVQILPSSFSTPLSSTHVEGNFWEKSDFPWNCSLLDSDCSKMLDKEYSYARCSQKIALEELNSRFAAFIEKVHNLERYNSRLDVELIDIKHKRASSTQISKNYEEELTKLHKEMELIREMYDKVHMTNIELTEDLKYTVESIVEETKKRTIAETKLANYKKETDDGTIEYSDLESLIEHLNSQISFLKKEHAQAISDVELNFNSLEVITQTGNAAQADLSAALKDIRAQYESIVVKINQDCNLSQFSSLFEYIKKNTTDLREAKYLVSDLQRKIQDLSLETETLKSRSNALEGCNKVLEDEIRSETDKQQNVVTYLEEEIHKLKAQMCQHMTQYQDLLNVKTALDTEITIYRKLLDEEDTGKRYPAEHRPGFVQIVKIREG